MHLLRSIVAEPIEIERRLKPKHSFIAPCPKNSDLKSGFVILTRLWDAIYPLYNTLDSTTKRQLPNRF